MFLFLRWDGLYVVIIVISGIDNLLIMFVLNENGQILILLRNDGFELVYVCVLVVVDKICEEVIVVVMRLVREFVWGYRSSIFVMGL